MHVRASSLIPWATLCLVRYLCTHYKHTCLQTYMLTHNTHFARMPQEWLSSPYTQSEGLGRTGDVTLLRTLAASYQTWLNSHANGHA
ncbi:hypothetical protein J3E74DRAFT_313446 [Bipolaris maydis]|nr:hypothetical protein J3E74DRAFT_313446 [Bipolaris maydis]